MTTPTITDAELETLRRFYGAATDRELIEAQAHHIEKLQSKLPPLRDEQPKKPRFA